MYGSERYALPLSRPFPVYVPRPSAVTLNKAFPPRGDMDDFAYHPEPPQPSSAENSSDNRSELMAPSELRDFSCFGSYVASVPISIPAPCYVCPSVAIKEPNVAPDIHPFGNNAAVPTEAAVDCDGLSIKEDERKPEEKQRKRSKNWTRPETLKLIRARSGIDAKFERTTGKKSELWDQIADSLQREGFARDAQQCKDKWEKLCAGYKDVKEGVREKEDFIYHDEIHSILAGRSKKRERGSDINGEATKEKHETAQIDELDLDLSGEFGFREEDSPCFHVASSGTFSGVHSEHVVNDQNQSKKREKVVEYVSVADLPAVQELMDSLLAKQQKFFTDLLDEMERKEQLKEKLRQEREDRWRAEEYEQRQVLNNAMVILTQRLLGGSVSNGVAASTGNTGDIMSDDQGSKKRSKNWKRSEVLQLIRLRIEMDSKFTMLTRRVGLWEEIAEALGSKGIRRDGKQCKEKWDKLMADFKDVTDGRRDQNDSPFFMELKPFMEQGHLNP